MARVTIPFYDDFNRADGAVGTSADGHAYSRFGGGQFTISNHRAIADFAGGAVYMGVTLGPVLTHMGCWASWTDSGGGGNADLVLHSSNAVNGRIAGTDGHYMDFVHAVFGNQQLDVNIYVGGGPSSTLGGQSYSLPNNGTDGTVYYMGYDLDVANNTCRFWLPKASPKGVIPTGVTFLRLTDPLIGQVAGPYTIWQIYNAPAPNISPVFEALRGVSERVAVAGRTVVANRTPVALRAAA